MWTLIHPRPPPWPVRVLKRPRRDITGVYCAAHRPVARSPSYPVPLTEEDVMRRFLGGLSLGVMSVFLTAGLAWAQLSTAQLSGRVTDKSAAVLPGVTVTATQTATGFTRSDVTDSNGQSILSNSPPGTYGFKGSMT